MVDSLKIQNNPILVDNLNRIGDSSSSPSNSPPSSTVNPLSQQIKSSGKPLQKPDIVDIDEDGF